MVCHTGGQLGTKVGLSALRMLALYMRFNETGIWGGETIRVNKCYFIRLRFPTILTIVSIVGSLRDREVACSASDRQGSNFESCVWRTVSSQSSHHPQEFLLAQFSLYVHKGGLKPDSFHFPAVRIRGNQAHFHDISAF